MNLDRTFCINNTCSKKDKCDRHIDHYIEFLKNEKWVSMSGFESCKDDYKNFIERKSNVKNR
jgi:hypothetical protein